VVLLSFFGEFIRRIHLANSFGEFIQWLILIANTIAHCGVTLCGVTLCGDALCGVALYGVALCGVTLCVCSLWCCSLWWCYLFSANSFGEFIQLLILIVNIIARCGVTLCGACSLCLLKNEFAENSGIILG
jgi:hypothetical protein